MVFHAIRCLLSFARVLPSRVIPRGNHTMKVKCRKFLHPAASVFGVCSRLGVDSSPLPDRILDRAEGSNCAPPASTPTIQVDLLSETGIHVKTPRLQQRLWNVFR